MESKLSKLEFLDYISSMRQGRREEFYMFKILKNEKIIRKFLDKLKLKVLRRKNIEARSKIDKKLEEEKKNLLKARHSTMLKFHSKIKFNDALQPG